MKTNRVKAIVLKRTNYGEADRILQFITPEGKISAIARGVRREKSKLSGGIELFAICDLVLGDGKSELRMVTSSKLDTFFGNIIKDYERMQFGYQAIDIVNRSSENIDGSSWYDVLAETLAGLDNFKINLALVQAWFYLRYSALMGHELSLWYDINGRELVPNERYAYDDSEKGLILNDNGEITSDHIKFMRLIESKSIKVLSQIGGVDGILQECMMIARRHSAIRFNF